MIKTAAIFPHQAARNSVPVLAAMREGMIRHGIRVQENSMDSDAVIIWSVLWSGRMRSNREVYQHYQALGRPVIVVDVGTLVRGTTWKIALDNINGSGWFGSSQDLDPDRPRRLGLIRSGPCTGPRVLIALQHGQSLQASAITDMADWAVTQARQIRQQTDRDIVIRPHPRDRVRFTHLPAGVTVENPKPVPGTYDSFDWQDSWHAVINHNSGPGVLAAVAGIRPVVHESSLAWSVAVNMQDIERPYQIDRDEWLIKLAHTEYTLEEISQGLWLKRLGSRL